MAALAFTAGITLVQSSPELPSSGMWWAISTVLIMLLALAFVWRNASGWRWWLRWGAVLLAVTLAGTAWASWRAEIRLAQALPMQWEQRDVAVTGVITSLPQVYDSGMVRFDFHVEDSPAPLPRRIRLSWYAQGWGGERFEVPQLRPGERWHMTVRLRRPHGLYNPHGFDREARWLEEDVRAVGYVRAQEPSQRLDVFVARPATLMHRVRDQVRERFQEQLGGQPYAGVLIALAVGDKRAIPPEQWEVMRITSVAHLVSISGMHVSLVAMFAGSFVAVLWWCAPALALRVPRRRAMVCGGLAVAALYACMAGLALPTRRAIVMLAAACCALLLGRETRPGRVLALALVAVLVLDPWSVRAAGFWLSFGAVAIIVSVVAGRFPQPGGLNSSIRIQLAITLALAPFLVALFGAFSIVSPLANALAIPLVTLFVTPLVLLYIIAPWPVLLEVAHFLTAWMMVALGWLAEHPFALWSGPAVPLAYVALAFVGSMWLLLPRGTPGKLAALLALLPMLMWSPPRPALAHLELTVFDVGQGLAAHVQTAHHDLLYDTGPPYGPVSDAGRRVLVPYLQAAGVERIDRLVVSHVDADHAGGALSVLEAVEVASVIADVGRAHPVRTHSAGRVEGCAAGRAWNWDGVQFEVLHPPPRAHPYDARNDDSCVLRVEAGGHVLLLTGDIEAAAERRLVREASARLASDVVVVPHHGSRTSSSPAFVRATGATHAIHSVGMLNRFRHPHPLVWARWDGAGARSWRTDAQGAIRVRMGENGVEIFAERERRRRYWHGR